MKQTIIDYFDEIILPDPVDEVLKQFKQLISDGHLKPGDKLPSERRLEARMRLPKGVINRALRMMETYGIIRTVPQSGTYVTSICVEALEGLMMNVISLHPDDINSLSDIRCLLEQHAVELIIKNESEEAINDLQRTQKSIREKVLNTTAGFDVDLVFHIKLATCADSPILTSILTKQIVNMMTLLEKHFVHLPSEVRHKRVIEGLSEHDQIVKAIVNKDVIEARNAVQKHFDHSQIFRETYNPY